jgi:hypothetical protein
LFLGLLDGRFRGLPESAIIAELLREYPRPAGATDHDSPNTAPPRETGSADDAQRNNAPSDITRAVAPRGVQLRISLGTVLAVDEKPGELPGWATITASVARRIAADPPARPTFKPVTERCRPLPPRPTNDEAGERSDPTVSDPDPP